MNGKKLLSAWGLKWNPFSADIPEEALYQTAKIESFAWRIENLIDEGGFALVSGDPGTGKSVVLRILAARLGQLRDVSVGVLTRPQSSIADFYRELGDIFGVKLRPHNRWAGFKMLRERWKAHVDSSLLRPLLLVDEAQQMSPAVLSELRLLSSSNFDSSSFLTVVLAGDSRLRELFRQDDLVPLGSRIRTRLVLDYATPQELRELLEHGLVQAGNPLLMSDELKSTLVEHSAGNCRLLMTMGGELLLAGLERKLDRLDEKLYFEVFQVPSGRGRGKSTARPAQR